MVKPQRGRNKSDTAPPTPPHRFPPRRHAQTDEPQDKLADAGGRSPVGELGWAASRGERNRKRKILTQLSPDPSEWQKILLSMSEGICHQHAIRAGP